LLLLLLLLFFSPNPRRHALHHQIRISPPNYAKFVSIPSATEAPFSFATPRKRSCKSDGPKTDAKLTGELLLLQRWWSPAGVGNTDLPKSEEDSWWGEG
jgi:hypothetical protein